jgi:hypothetical protein
MAQKTYDQLSNEATGIINETRAGFNTAARIGGVFQDIIDSAQLTLSSAEPYYAVDLSAGAFSITTNGIYEIVGTGHAITFPNPANYVGQKVTLLNSTEIDANIDGSRPLTISNENEVNLIVGGAGMIFIAASSRWILISQI